MPVTEFAKEKRAQLVQAAFRAFARNGYANTTMKQVAEEAQIGKSTLYEYFGSKAELFMALHGWLIDTLSEASAQALEDAGESSVERLRAIARTVTGILTDMKDLCSLITEAWAANATHDLRQELSSSYLKLYQDYRTTVQEILQKGIDQGELRPDIDTETIARGMVGYMDGLFLQAWFDKSLRIETMTTDFLEYLITGIARNEIKRNA